MRACKKMDDIANIAGIVGGVTTHGKQATRLVFEQCSQSKVIVLTIRISIIYDAINLHTPTCVCGTSPGEVGTPHHPLPTEIVTGQATIHNYRGRRLTKQTRSTLEFHNMYRTLVMDLMWPTGKDVWGGMENTAPRVGFESLLLPF